MPYRQCQPGLSTALYYSIDSRLRPTAIDIATRQYLTTTVSQSQLYDGEYDQDRYSECSQYSDRSGRMDDMERDTEHMRLPSETVSWTTSPIGTDRCPQGHG